jgi:hypothetical protein
MQTTTEQQPTLSNSDIAKVAWGIWQQEGCQHGRDLEHWLKAEQQLLAAKRKQIGVARKPAAKPRPTPIAVRQLANGKVS